MSAPSEQIQETHYTIPVLPDQWKLITCDDKGQQRYQFHWGLCMITILSPLRFPYCERTGWTSSCFAELPPPAPPPKKKKQCHMPYSFKCSVTIKQYITQNSIMTPPEGTSATTLKPLVGKGLHQHAAKVHEK